MQDKKVIDSKVAVIDSEGVIHTMGKANEAESHAEYFKDYIETNYPNIDVSNLTIGSPRDRFGYILGRFGNVIYFNDLDSGMIYFPDELTEAQVNTLCNLDLGNQRIVIFYNLEDYGAFICSQPIGLDFENSGNLKEVMGKYLKMGNDPKRK